LNMLSDIDFSPQFINTFMTESSMDINTKFTTDIDENHVKMTIRCAYDKLVTTLNIYSDKSLFSALLYKMYIGDSIDYGILITFMKNEKTRIDELSTKYARKKTKKSSGAIGTKMREELEKEFQKFEPIHKPRNNKTQFVRGMILKTANSKKIENAEYFFVTDFSADGSLIVADNKGEYQMINTHLYKMIEVNPKDDVNKLVSKIIKGNLSLAMLPHYQKLYSYPIYFSPIDGRHNCDLISQSNYKLTKLRYFEDTLKNQIPLFIKVQNLDEKVNGVYNLVGDKNVSEAPVYYLENKDTQYFRWHAAKQTWLISNRNDGSYTAIAFVKDKNNSLHPGLIKNKKWKVEVNGIYEPREEVKIEAQFFNFPSDEFIELLDVFKYGDKFAVCTSIRENIFTLTIFNNDKNEPWIKGSEKFQSISELFTKGIIRIGNVEEMNLDNLESLYFLNKSLYELLHSNDVKSLPSKLSMHRFYQTLTSKEILDKIKEVSGFKNIQNQLIHYPDSEWKLVTKHNEEADDQSNHEFYAAENIQIHEQLKSIKESINSQNKLNDEEMNQLIEYLKEFEYLEEVLELFKSDTHSLKFTTKGWQKLSKSLLKLYDFLEKQVPIVFRQANHKRGSSHTHMMQIGTLFQPVKTTDKQAHIDGTSISVLKSTLYRENIPTLLKAARENIEETMMNINKQNSSIMKEIMDLKWKYSTLEASYREQSLLFIELKYKELIYSEFLQIFEAVLKTHSNRFLPWYKKVAEYQDTILKAYEIHTEDKNHELDLIYSYFFKKEM